MTTDEIKLLIVQKAKELGVDPLFALSISKQESNFNPLALSSRGAIGLFQLMPATAQDMGVADLYDPYQNAEGGIKYLRILANKYIDRPDLVLAAYNWGMGNINRLIWGSTSFPDSSLYPSQQELIGNPSLPQETRDYISRVFSNMAILANDPALLGDTGGTSIIPTPDGESGVVDIKTIAALAVIFILAMIALRRY